MTTRHDVDRHRDLLKLYAAISDAKEAKRHVPCLSWIGDLWLSDQTADQRQAAQACQACAVIESCRTYVSTHKETDGVWAGLTPIARGEERTKPKTRTRRKKGKP